MSFGQNSLAPAALSASIAPPCSAPTALPSPRLPPNSRDHVLQQLVVTFRNSRRSPSRAPFRCPRRAAAPRPHPHTPPRAPCPDPRATNAAADPLPSGCGTRLWPSPPPPTPPLQLRGTSGARKTQTADFPLLDHSEPPTKTNVPPSASKTSPPPHCVPHQTYRAKTLSGSHRLLVAQLAVPCG